MGVEDAICYCVRENQPYAIKIDFEVRGHACSSPRSKVKTADYNNLFFTKIR